MTQDHSGRHTTLPNSRTTPRFGGLVTFGRYPRLEDVVSDNRPVDWAIVGVPADGGVSYRPGTRFGPRAVRDESQYLKRYSMVHDVDVCDVLSLADAGDCPVSPYDLKANAKCIRDFIVDLPDAGTTRALCLGGDHSLSYPAIEAAWIRAGKPAGGLALLHFDSHLDTVDVVWGETHGHASPFIRGIEAGVIDPKAMISVGIKGPLNTASDLDYARDHGVTVLTKRDLDRRGLDPLRAFVAGLGNRPAYITYDIDVVDPSVAPGTGTPSVGGVDAAMGLELVRACSGATLVGSDVVEVLPDRDVGGVTALLAAHIAFEILSLDAVHRIV